MLQRTRLSVREFIVRHLAIKPAEEAVRWLKSDKFFGFFLSPSTLFRVRITDRSEQWLRA